MSNNKRLIERFSKKKISPERKVLGMWDEIDECLRKGISRKKIYDQCKKDGHFDFTYVRFTQILRKKMGKNLVGEAAGIGDIKNVTPEKIEKNSSGGVVDAASGTGDIEGNNEGVVSDDVQTVEGGDSGEKDVLSGEDEKSGAGSDDEGVGGNKKGKSETEDNGEFHEQTEYVDMNKFI